MQCCCAHTQHTQHTQRTAVVHPQEHPASYLWPELCGKTSVNGCFMAQIGLQSHRLLAHVTGDSLPPEVNFVSEVAPQCIQDSCLSERERAFSQRLAQTGPAALISTWLAGISWKYASHYTFLDQEVKLGGFVLSHGTFILSLCPSTSMSQLIAPFPVSHEMRWGKMGNLNFITLFGGLAPVGVGARGVPLAF